MRRVSKIAFSFLIWPISVMAQDHPPLGRPPSPTQSPAGPQGFAPSSDSTTTPSPTPEQIPVLVQPAPAFLYLRSIKKPAVIQTPVPVAAGYAPLLNISGGLSVTSLGTPSAGRAVLSGMNFSISRDSGKWLGAKLDFSYTRAPNAFHTGYRMDAISYLVGPVFYPSTGNSLSTYAHVLVGGARVSGPFPNGNGGLNVGYVNYPAWAFGGGAEYRISRAFGFRVGVDYLRTHFVNSSRAVRGQNDFRIVNSFVYYFGKSIRNRR
jgi:hypothetical protein